MATAEGNEARYALKTLSGNVFHSSRDPMQSILMERFVKGLKARMPVESNRNAPITGDVVKRFPVFLAGKLFIRKRFIQTNFAESTQRKVYVDSVKISSRKQNC